MSSILSRGAALLPVALAWVSPAAAQDALDRVEPSSVARENPPMAPETTKPPAPVAVDAPSGASAVGSAILVGAVTLQGLEVLRPADFADIIATRIGQTLTPEELAALATAIAERARARGYPFASAWIGRQRLQNGVLTVSVDEGRVDEVRLDGPALPAVRAALAPLANGRPATLEEVEHRILIAGDIDGVRIGRTRFVREDGKGVLIVGVSKDRVAGRAALSNEGTKPLGPEQLRLDVDLNSIFASDDSFTLTYSGTPFEPRELEFGRARYARRVSPGGTEIALSASASVARPGAYLDQWDLQSRSWYIGASVLQPLSRRRAASLWFEGELGLRKLVQWRADTRVRRDRIPVARMTLYGYGDIAGGRLRVSTTVSQGLGILDATQMGDPLASRGDADATFTTLNAWTDWTTGLGGDFSLRLAVQSQLASQPLLITEETGLGGTGFLRGYDWAERTGDQGAMGMAELRYAWDKPLGLLRRAQLYTYVDGGKVSNLDGGFGGGSIASAGGGVRADVTGHMGANLEVAVPLTGARYDTGDQSPKLSFRLVQSF